MREFFAPLRMTAASGRMRHPAHFVGLKAMQITVTIPDELAAQTQTQARGLDLASYLPELLAEDVAAESSVRPPSVPDGGDEGAARRNAAVDPIRALRQGNLLAV